jgi:hypothetical protein
MAINEKNVLHSLKVDISRHDGMWIVRKGLAADDWIVVSDIKKLTDGMTVKIKRVAMKDTLSQPDTTKPRQPKKEPPPPGKVKDLLKERRDLLHRAADLTMRQYDNGTATPEAVMHAQRAVLDAELDLCDTPAERIVVLRKKLEVMESLVAKTEMRVTAGVAREADLLQARAQVLEVRIQLLREEDKAKKP